jgi:hypothetical protein
MPSLGSTLFSELSPKFFSLLGGPNARLYLDVLDGLEKEMSARGDAMERVEVLEIIDRSLVPGIQLERESDDESTTPDAESASNKVLRRLIAAGWIEEERRSDYRHVLFLEPAALTLIEALRTIVSQNIASFTGKLRLVCDRLSALRNPHSRSELIWEQLRHCLIEVKAGLRELRSIRKQVERYARRQLTTTTIAEALDIIYNEFSALITQQCYRELIHARLPERLREAMEGLRELEQDDLALQNLRNDYARIHPDAGQAMPEILRTIEAISLGLGDVEPTADRVDAGTADFARRSRARIRYIQDVGSARRQQVKVIFDFVREKLGGIRLADLGDLIPPLGIRLADPGLVGMQSLTARRQRPEAATRQPVAPPLSEAEKEASLLEMEKNIRNSLRLDRANRFVDRLDLDPGDVLSSEHMPIHTEDDILDVVSCLVFAPAGGANFRLHLYRDQHPGDAVPNDLKGEFKIERFAVEKK